MTDPNCLWCKILAGELPSTKFYEDQNFIAIFDAFPHVEGQALLISKNHMTSKFEDVPDEVLTGAILSAKKVSQNLKKAFNSERIVQVTEGLQVDHMHMKLFPVENPERFSLAMLNEHYPQAKDMLSPEKFEKLKRKFEEGVNSKDSEA